MLVSKVTKTHKKTSAFRRTGARTACPLEGGTGPDQACAPCPCGPAATGGHNSLKRLVKETISKNHVGVVSGGLWDVRVWPGSACSRPLPASALHEVTPVPLWRCCAWLYAHLSSSATEERGLGPGLAGPDGGVQPPSQEWPASSGGAPALS